MSHPIPSPASTSEPRPLAAWRALALDLPRHHPELVAGRDGVFAEALAGLPAIGDADLRGLSDAELRLAGLDVLMVEAVVRRHGLPRSESTLDASASVVAERLGLQPIISYPLYIRENPVDLAEMRRFTAYEAEFRFIRMHAAIEDLFDQTIASLEAIIDSDAPRMALREHFAGLSAGLRSANRIMSGFRSPVRMPHADFFDGFRPYYDALRDRDSGELILDGPSGLQSYTYRIVAMQLGYRDPVLDGWTERIGRYHPPDLRDRLDRVLRARNAGRNLDARVCEPILGGQARLPHLHPDYGRHLPSILRIAEGRGYLRPEVRGLIEGFGLRLGEWPARMSSNDEVPEIAVPAGIGSAEMADLSLLAELEAALVAMHLEHVATAAVQIGAEHGTGGTSGVEFLLVATFRRAFPALWQSGIGARIAAEA
ncbi:MAG: hypothetical protein KDH92_03310 [Chloroflexi bacterium]|nr:hypothetical protein [Chloroflexota bacterium]